MHPFMSNLEKRVSALNWSELQDSLAQYGYARTPPVLTADECGKLVRLYSDDSRFRSHIDMARYRFGIGEYKYFAYPLPEIVEQLRYAFYPAVARVANLWAEQLGLDTKYPATLTEFLAVCHKKGQRKPTPLLLKYESGGYNCLHQDLYGEIAFPLQLTCFLSEPGRDYTGGEFLLVEQRPRAQSKGEAILPRRGEIVIFTTRYRPMRGTRGYYRASIRHGVSRILSGSRYTLGVIFHDAR